MKSCTDSHDPQRVNPNNIKDPSTFHVVKSGGQILHLSSEISQHLQDGLAQNVAQTLMVP